MEIPSAWINAGPQNCVLCGLHRPWLHNSAARPRLNMSLSVDQALRKAKSHARKGATDLAAQQYRSVLEKYPKNKQAIEGLKTLQQPTAVIVAGNAGPSRQRINGLTALYKQGKLQETLVQGEALAKQFPNEPVIANLLGAVYVGLGHLEEAVANYTRALQIKPDFAEAHNNLGNVLKSLGKPEEAVASYHRALLIKPDFAEAHSNLGDALNDLGKPEEAVASYHRALQIKPDFVVAHNNLGAALNDLGKPEEAVSSLTKALQIQPNLAEAHSNLGVALNELGKPEEAALSLTRAVQLKPDFAEAHINLGTTLNDLGKPDEAVAIYNRALQINPAFAKAHRFLSTVKKFQDADPQIYQMLQLVERNNLPDEDRIHLNFALAKAHEDLGNYDRAFSYFIEGNRLRKDELSYEVSSTRASFAKIKTTFSKDVPALSVLKESESAKGQQPVFVLGMPRSGTTLVEQILASHSQVYGAGELVLLGQSVNSIEWTSTQLSSDQLQSVRKSYLSGLTKIGVSEPYVTDKMPVNLRWIGFIIAAIPEARIVHVKRDARATCWSNFKHYFSGKGNDFAYGLQEVTEYYKMYIDLMAFWHEKYPGRVYDLDYEALTEHQEHETRKLFEYIGLNWEDQCLEFHKTRRAVQTASVTQVRQKIYQGSSDEWRNYEKHLGSMVELLRGF